MELYIIALVGVLLHLLSKLAKAIQREDFSFNIFLKNNGIMFLFGIIAALALIYIFVDPILQTKEFDVWIERPVAFVCGWFSGSILNNLVGMVKKAIDNRISKIK